MRSGWRRGPRSRLVPEIGAPAAQAEGTRRRLRRRRGAGTEPGRRAGSGTRAGTGRRSWPPAASGSRSCSCCRSTSSSRSPSARSTSANFGQPVPYYAPWWWSFETFDATLSKFYAGTAIYQPPLFRTFVYVFAATAICLVLGYTVAYYAARGATKYKGLILILLVSPLWISYLMRIYAWQGVLEKDGPINFLLEPDRVRPDELARRPARHRDPRPRLRLHPVHDPADLRLARPHPGEPAGSGS